MSNNVDVSEPGVVGAFYREGRGTNFKVWAPKKAQVRLWFGIKTECRDVRGLTTQQLCVAGWQVRKLKKNKRGYWSGSFNVKPGTLYLYELISESLSNLYPDPGSWSQPFGVHGPSEVVDSNFPWEDSDWKGIRWEDAVIYQSHPALMSPDGTLAGSISQIPHVASLGFNVWYHLPIMQFDGNHNLGYDGAYPRAVHNALGGLKSAQKLVNALHKAGLAVAFDCHEQNHMGPEGAYLWNFGPYFTDCYQTPWGSAKNNDQAGAAGQRRSLIETLRFYFKVLHADVIRMDACHQVYDSSDYHILCELQDEVERLSQELGRPLYLMAETDSDDGVIVKPKSNGGFGWRAQLYDGLHHSVRVFQYPESTAYFQDYKSSAEFPLQALARVLELGYQRHYSAYHKKWIGAELPRELPISSLVMPLSNHDQVANFYGKRLAHLMDFETMKAYMGFGMLLPNPPFVFFGDEFACKNPFYFFTDFQDTQLAEAVSRGRLEEFKDFYQDIADFPDPQAQKTFDDSHPDFNNLDEEQKLMLKFVQECLTLRNQLGAIKQDARQLQSVSQFKDVPVLMLERQKDNQGTLMLLNLGTESHTVQFESAVLRWCLCLDSASKRWGGKTCSSISEESSTVTISPSSVILISGNLVQV